MLERIRVVLCNTTHPGNIGAAARAMKTMGLSDLALVSPKEFPCAEATARASGADNVLHQATVHDTLEQAVADCRLVIGASARLRRVPMEQVDARSAAQRIAEGGKEMQAALLFGQERTGLTNDEIDRCHLLLHIPANDAYSSLNMASAVQVVGYEMRMTALIAGAVAPPPSPEHLPARQERVDGMFQHLEQTLSQIGFLDQRQPQSLRTRLHRLFNRANPSDEEIDILRGIFATVQRVSQSQPGRNRS